MATIYIETNIHETKKWVGKIKKAIHRSKRTISSAIAMRGKKVLQTGLLGKGGAPKGVRSGMKALRNSGIVRAFGDQAILSIRKDNVDIALVNEFGMAEKRYLRFEDFPELQDWAIKKYDFYTPELKGLWVGKPETTAFGKTNVFWLPLFERLGRETPYIMAKEIEKELKKELT